MKEILVAVGFITCAAIAGAIIGGTAGYVMDKKKKKKPSKEAEHTYVIKLVEKLNS